MSDLRRYEGCPYLFVWYKATTILPCWNIASMNRLPLVMKGERTEYSRNPPKDHTEALNIFSAFEDLHNHHCRKVSFVVHHLHVDRILHLCLCRGILLRLYLLWVLPAPYCYHYQCDRHFCHNMSDRHFANRTHQMALQGHCGLVNQRHRNLLC